MQVVRAVGVVCWLERVREALPGALGNALHVATRSAVSEIVVLVCALALACSLGVGCLAARLRVYQIGVKRRRLTICADGRDLKLT